MANIIITLPRKLWWAIEHGYKTYECRKSCPLIKYNQSKVYVVEKGTTKVIGCFTIDSIVASNDFAMIWQKYGKKLFIDRDWFLKYVTGYKRLIHLWKIGAVYKFEQTIDLEEVFGVKHNPQSFIYTDCEPYIHLNLVRVLDVERNRLVSPSTWLKRKNEDDLPF